MINSQARSKERRGLYIYLFFSSPGALICRTRLPCYCEEPHPSKTSREHGA
jgi:hypothetical protein